MKVTLLSDLTPTYRVRTEGRTFDLQGVFTPGGRVTITEIYEDGDSIVWGAGHFGHYTVPRSGPRSKDEVVFEVADYLAGRLKYEGGERDG